MTHWNYRIVKQLRQDTEEIFFGVHECYYDDDGKVGGWTENAVAPVGDSPDDIKWTLERMTEALNRSIIENI